MYTAVHMYMSIWSNYIYYGCCREGEGSGGGAQERVKKLYFSVGMHLGHVEGKQFVVVVLF